ncbi:uncharacterized protein LOC123037403 [Drosophila rhopaloa]|uniref:MARVEL domain-containing protein n=1 Tax=Drosophila rhopaloa TaxID=1041015 RepID=A0ABM5J4G7_DRORH|nr:uncharacterized protein LOC123037403 [Drosophila rhopaloa]
MWSPKKFCCCISLRTGYIIISFFTLCLCTAHQVEFFRLKEHHDYVYPSDWLNLMWVILHLLASMCLSYSMLVESALLSILVYLIIEIIYLMYVIIYASVSCALRTNTYANQGLGYCITFWVLVVLTCVITTYFLYIISSYYILRRQQRIASHQVQQNLTN